MGLRERKKEQTRQMIAETAWRLFSELLGPRSGRQALSELQFWVRTVRETTQRQIRCFPTCCRHLCHDECMVVAAIAAHQHRDDATALAAMHYLTGVGEKPALDRIMDASGSFAEVLASSGQTLLAVPGSVVQDLASRGDTRQQASH